MVEGLRHMSVKKHSKLQQIADAMERLKAQYTEADEKIVARYAIKISALHVQGSEIARDLHEQKRDVQRNLTIDCSKGTITSGALAEHLAHLNKPLLDLATRYEHKIEDTRAEQNAERTALKNEFTAKMKELERKRRELDLKKDTEETSEEPTSPGPDQSPDPASAH